MESATDLIARLGLEPHPEGGWYREVHRSTRRLSFERGARSALTSIYYLLERGQKSRWHVVDSDEIWHYHYGAPLELLGYSPARGELTRFELGTPANGRAPIGAIPAGDWQAARSLGDWTLVGCDVGPGFDFEDFQFVSALPDHAAHFRAALAPHADLL